MLIRQHDAASDDECRQLLEQNDFGQLIAAGSDRRVPVVVPTHFVFRADPSDHIVLHLAKPNPVWEAIDENPMVLLTVIADWTYIRTDWNAAPGTDPTYGIPTSYYATAQVTCAAKPLTESSEIASVLTTQLSHFQPDGGHGNPLDPHTPYSTSIRAIRGLHLDIVEMRGKFKYGGNKDEEHRAMIAEQLEQHGGPGSAAAAGHLRRRSVGSGAK